MPDVWGLASAEVGGVAKARGRSTRKCQVPMIRHGVPVARGAVPDWPAWGTAEEVVMLLWYDPLQAVYTDESETHAQPLRHRST